MSLINDALKRASQSDRNRPRPTGTHASMQPVAEGRGRSFSLVLGIGIVLALGLAGWFFGQWWHASHSPAPIAANEETPAAIVAPTPAPAPVAHEAIVPPPAPDPAPAPPAKPVPEAWPANLKLMGIFFSTANTRAIINGKTLVVGDMIDGIRVTKIEHDQVTVEWNGQVKKLIIE